MISIYNCITRLKVLQTAAAAVDDDAVSWLEIYCELFAKW